MASVSLPCHLNSLLALPQWAVHLDTHDWSSQWDVSSFQDLVVHTSRGEPKAQSGGASYGVYISGKQGHWTRQGRAERLLSLYVVQMGFLLSVFAPRLAEAVTVEQLLFACYDNGGAP